MLVDVTLIPSRVQQFIHWLGLAMLVSLIWASALPWALSGAGIVLLLGLQGWLSALAARRRIKALWQADSYSWYWQCSQGRRHSGKLLQVRHLGLVIHLTFMTAGRQSALIAVWRDQVSAAQWRRLCVVHSLHDSQQNWF